MKAAALLLALALAVPSLAPAQVYTLDWFSAAGTVGTSSAGAYTARAVIGPPGITVPMVGGPFAAVGIFSPSPLSLSVLEQTVDELAPFSTQAVASGAAPGRTLTWSLVSGPPGLAISPDALITWTPDESQGPSTNTVFLSVSEVGTPPPTAINSFQLTVDEVNRAPVLDPVPNTNATAESLFSFTAHATDPDLPANRLTFALINPPAGATIDSASGVVSWTPTAAQAGANLLTVAVFDDGVPSLSATQTCTVTVQAPFSDANWISLGGLPGANGNIFGNIFATVLDGAGNLYVGGRFTIIGTVPATNIAKWDGTAWSALGEGVMGEVYALAVAGTDLYVGGSFTNAGGVSANRIAKWDGSVWSALGSGIIGSSLSASVAALAPFGADLYAGGDFMMAGGKVSTYLAKAQIGPPSPAPVCLQIHLPGAQVLVEWPGDPEGYRLLSNTNLATTNWTEFAPAGTNRIFINPAEPARFFRAVKP